MVHRWVWLSDSTCRPSDWLGATRLLSTPAGIGCSSPWPCNRRGDIENWRIYKKNIPPDLQHYSQTLLHASNVACKGLVTSSWPQAGEKLVSLWSVFLFSLQMDGRRSARDPYELKAAPVRSSNNELQPTGLWFRADGRCSDFFFRTLGLYKSLGEFTVYNKTTKVRRFLYCTTQHGFKNNLPLR